MTGMFYFECLILLIQDLKYTETPFQNDKFSTTGSIIKYRKR